MTELLIALIILGALFLLFLPRLRRRVDYSGAEDATAATVDADAGHDEFEVSGRTADTTSDRDSLFHCRVCTERIPNVVTDDPVADLRAAGLLCRACSWTICSRCMPSDEEGGLPTCPGCRSPFRIRLLRLNGWSQADYEAWEQARALDKHVQLRQALVRGKKAGAPETKHPTHPGSSGAVGAGVDAAGIAVHLQALGQPMHPEWYVAYQALQYLGQRAVVQLIPAIRSDNYLLRLRAMDLLGTIGDSRTLRPLEEAAGISTDDFKRLASAAGGSVVIRTMSGSLEIPLSDALKEYRDKAAEALASVRERFQAGEDLKHALP